MGGLVLGGAWSRGGGAWSGGACSQGGGLVETPPTATAAGGTHPTGMHSCFTSGVFIVYFQRREAAIINSRFSLLDGTRMFKWMQI